MADPIMDEENIRLLLSSPPGLDNIGMIQCGAAQALLDMYDRKVTRAEFVEHASKCLALYAQCAKLWLINNVEIAHTAQPLDHEAFERARTGISDIIRAQSMALIEQVKRLEQCPTSQDKVH